MKAKQIFGLLAACALILYLIFFGTNNPGEITPIFSAPDKKPVHAKDELVIGVRKGEAEYWKAAAKILKERDIKLKVVEYKNVSKLNDYVADKTLDINCFQTIKDFKEDMAANNLNLEILTRTTAEPYKIYSSEMIELKDLKKKATILIPSSEEGCTRALITINQAGVITLTPDKIVFDITDVQINPLNLHFKKVSEDEAKKLFDRGALACVDSSLAKKAGISGNSFIIYTEPIKYDGCPFVEIAVVRKGDSEKKELKELISVLKSKEIKKEIELAYKDVRIAAY